MKRVITIAAALSMGTTAATAGACPCPAGLACPTDRIKWQANSAPYDRGYWPSVTLASPFSGQMNQVEVHQGDYPNLWDHPVAPYAAFGNSKFYNNGAYPTVASDQVNNFVEVHMGDNTTQNPALWYSTSTDGANWVDAPVGLTGLWPYVAARPNAIVEVHQQTRAASPLIFDVGYPTHPWFSNGFQAWQGVSQWKSGQYNWGAYPSVAIEYNFAGSVTGNSFLVMEVHQGNLDNQLLWSTLGVLNITPTGWTIQWGPSEQFTQGSYPSVAICHLAGGASAGGTATVVEVNQGTNNDGTLWSHSGQITFSGSQMPCLSWDSSSAQHYTNGYHPHVDCIQEEGIEVHQGVANSGPLWYATFIVN